MNVRRELVLPVLCAIAIGGCSPAAPSASAPGAGTDSPAAQGVTVTVQPSEVEVRPGEEVTFTASVFASADVGVSWRADEGGAVDGAGRYTAPSAPGVYHVVATSRAEPAARAVATVTVQAVASGGAPGGAGSGAPPPSGLGTGTGTGSGSGSGAGAGGGVTPVPAGAVARYGHDRNAGASDDPAAAPYGGVARYAVPSGGSSTGACPVAAPCTVDRAIAAASTGDTIYLRGGTYRTPLTIGKNGSASRPIELRSYPGEWAVFDGAGQRNGTSGFLTWSGASYWVIRNFEVKGFDDPGVTTTKGLLVTGGGHHVVENVYSHHHKGVGIKLADSSFNTIVNCTSAENYDPQNGGGNADGFEADHASDNTYRRCVSIHNSDDGYDANYSSRIRYEDCVSAYNGYGGGDGNGFKCAWPGYGDNTLVRVIAIGNQSSGIDDEMGGPILVENATIYDQSLAFRLRGSVRQTIVNTVLAGSTSSMLNGAGVKSSLGGAFGGSVSASDFESVDLADLNSSTPGHRFFYPVAAKLIDRGTSADLPYVGSAPDLGAVESGQ